jgi:carboxypeptidase C (cathepsin A)
MTLGVVDFACNFIGVRKWVERLSWSGAKAYQASEERPWYLPDSDEIAGEVRTGGNGLTFATVRGAGHLGEQA